jgi:hypothetical protein
VSKPTNSAARNQMTEWERQCYDWGWEDAEERIIKLLESNNKLCTEKTVCIEANEGYPCNCIDLIDLIKGEHK